MSRRQGRSNRVPTRAARRAVNKELIVVQKAAIVNVQVATVIKPGAGFPSTLTGLRWSLQFIRDAGALLSSVRWAIVVVPDGAGASTMSFTDTNTLYQPEQNVLAFGQAVGVGAGAIVNLMDGTTKTMRKLRVGDQVHLLLLGSVAVESWTCTGTVQFFEKS